MRVSQALAAASAAFFALTSVSVADSPPINGNGVSARAVRAAVAEAISAPKPNPMELIYVAITPCRLFNTGAIGGRIAAQTSRAFQVIGTSGFEAQGGKAGGCGIPDAAVAISTTITAVDATAAGYLTAFPTGTTRPDSTSLNYQQNLASSGNPIVSIGTGQISVFSRQLANALGDVTGYYLPQIQVYMNPNGTAYAGTTRILATSKLGTGSYKIDVDRNMQLCSVHVNIDGGYYYGSAYPSGSSIYVTTWAISSGTPTATDLYHNVSAKC